MTRKEANDLIEEHAAKQSEMTTLLSTISADVLASGTPEAKKHADKLVELNNEAKRLEAKIKPAIEHFKSEDQAKARETAAENFASWQGEFPPSIIHPGSTKDAAGAFDSQFFNVGRAFTDSEVFKNFNANRSKISEIFSVEEKSLRGTLGYHKALITTDAGFAPQSIRTPGRIVELAHRPVQLYNMLSQVPTSQEAVVYMEQTERQGAAVADAAVAEGAVYSQGNFQWVQRRVEVEEYGQYIPVTKIQLEDVPRMQGMLNRNLMNTLGETIDGELINGTGVDNRILGFLNKTGINDIAKPSDENILIGLSRALEAASGTSTVDYGTPNMILLNRQDYWEMRRLQNKIGDFLLKNLGQGEVPDQRMLMPFGVPSYMMNALPAGTGFTGDFANWCEIADRRRMTVQFTDRFAVVMEGGRMLTAPTAQMYLVASVRLALIIDRAKAFTKVTGLAG